MIKCCSDGGMVDTKDLKSFGHCGCAGSSPAPSTEDASNEASFFYSLRENMDGSKKRCGIDLTAIRL